MLFSLIGAGHLGSAIAMHRQDRGPIGRRKATTRDSRQDRAPSAANPDDAVGGVPVGLDPHGSHRVV